MNNMKEVLKNIGMNAVRNILKVFFIFPVKNNRIIFESYMGKQYSCNPKYISEELLKSKSDYEIIWAFEHPEHFGFLKRNGIKVIHDRGVVFWYYRLTSRISVTNVMWKNYTPVRKEQYEIQTWHGGGGGYKKTLADDKEELKHKITLKRQLMNFQRYSLVLTSSETSLRTNARQAMQYKGVVLGGTPRNDILINKNRPEIGTKVRDYFHIDNKEIHLALYAPTWRKGATKADFDLDYGAFRDALKEKFGGDWIILRRMHWMAASFFNESCEDYISAEQYPDMQELLYAVDVLVSDYSSSIWDFSFTYKPCFLLCFDLSKYKEDRDFYNPITSWGFPLAENNAELVSNVKMFNKMDYQMKMNEQHEKNNSFETGHTAEYVCEIIRSMCYGDGKLPNGLPLHKIIDHE